MLPFPKMLFLTKVLITHFNNLMLFSPRPPLTFIILSLNFSQEVNCSGISYSPPRFLVLMHTQYLLFPSLEISVKFVLKIFDFCAR